MQRRSAFAAWDCGFRLFLHVFFPCSIYVVLELWNLVDEAWWTPLSWWFCGERVVLPAPGSFGRLHNGHCGCDRQHALLLDSCVPCHKLHLQCNQSGSAATTAIPQRGYTRLEPFAQEATQLAKISDRYLLRPNRLLTQWLIQKGSLPVETPL